MMIPTKYRLPSFLEGVLSLEVYKNWLDHRSDELYMRDRKRKCPYALNGSKQLYKETIHAAVQSGGPNDPYTGDALRFDLIGQWAHSKKELDALDDAQRKAFALLPVIDHTDPYAEALRLEICSWQINYCKSSSTPEEFVTICKNVVDFCCSHGGPALESRLSLPPLTAPAKYFLPDFLQGRVSLAVYKHWLYVRARELLAKDLRRQKPYAIGRGVPFYKDLIHAAVNGGGQTDPFTGRPLAWELIGTWDDSAASAHDPAVMKKFAPLPTADHVDPSAEALAFEICSFEINKCKSYLNPEEFVAQCKRIVEFRKRKVGFTAKNAKV